MSRTRRIAATAVIVATATLGAAGVANASESHYGHDGRGHDGYSRDCNYNNHNSRYDNRYDNRRDDRYDDRYDNRNRYDDCRYERGLVADVLHLVGNIL